MREILPTPRKPTVTSRESYALLHRGAAQMNFRRACVFAAGRRFAYVAAPCEFATACGVAAHVCSVTVMVEMAARAAKHVMFADKANARNFHRIARLRTKSAKFRSWSKCAKFLDRANPYYPPMRPAVVARRRPSEPTIYVQYYDYIAC